MSSDVGAPTGSDARGASLRGEPPARRAARVALGLGLVLAGISHLTFARDEFRAQVPGWFPLDEDLTVLVSGAVEVVLGAGLVLSRRRMAFGLLTAAFFVVIFPGNVAQWVEGTDAFGLDDDRSRLVRLFFQPVLVAWALWCSGALDAARRRRS